MDWKEFLKPGKWNSIVFTVIVFSYFILIEFSVKFEPIYDQIKTNIDSYSDIKRIFVESFIGIYSILQFVFVFFLTLPLLPIGFILLMKETSGVNSEIINLLLKILMVIYWYLLSCIIIWVYNKRKKKKR
jgi:uncharacterized BrkB/YihY/UPF0761 family membrane protein